jgi:hypothetical protein
LRPFCRESLREQPLTRQLVAQLDKRWRRKEEEDDREGPHISDMEKEEDGGVLWTIRKYVGLQMGPTATKTYIMAYFKELKNYNGSYP